MNSSGFERFCGGNVWDTNLSWNTSPPDVTSCFKASVLVWVPCGLLWLMTPFYISYLRGQDGPPTPKNQLNTAKTVISILLLVATLANIIVYVVDIIWDRSPPLVSLVSPIVLALTLLLCIIYIQYERYKGLITSGVLFMFWFFLALAGTVSLYSTILNDVQQGTWNIKPTNIIFYVFYGLLLPQFILFCFAEKKPEYENDKNICPEVKSSFLSRMLYWWQNGLVAKAYRNQLLESEMYRLHPRDLTEKTASSFQHAWKQELLRCKWNTTDTRTNKETKRLRSQSPSADERTPLLGSEPRHDDQDDIRIEDPNKKKPSLVRVLASVYGWDLLIANSFKLISDVATFSGPLLQSALITYAENIGTDHPSAQWKGYLYAFLYFPVAFIGSISMNQLFIQGNLLGLRIKAGMMSAVYKKALTISNEARKDTTVGEIVNLMAIDSDRLQEVIPFLWMIWSSPLQIVIAMVFLYQLLGVSAFAGLAILVLLLPINAVLAKIQQNLQTRQMELKDKRIKLMSEILNGIKVLKLYAWEMSFQEKVEAVRKIELENVQKFLLLNGGQNITWTMAPFTVMLLTFTTYVMTGNILDSRIAFVSLSLFNILQFPITVLPMMVSFLITASVSIKRIGGFLRQTDINPDEIKHDVNARNPVTITDGTFAWGSGENDAHTLKKIDLTIEEGSLVAVVGQVGSGKSSLCSAMLGEMVKIQGQISIKESVAYVAQQAWIQNASLQDNILFSKTMDAKIYDDVLEACALKPDLEILPAGDKTEIGEKGINLSGGQKQRVALARAVYQDEDIYLLDDPLSAVDAHVGKHIFDKVVGKQGILKNKTRILVTHGVHWLPQVDKIVVLMGGCISEMGTYGELVSHDGPFAQFLKTYLLQETEEDEEDIDPELQEVRRQMIERIDSVCSDPHSPGIRSGRSSSESGTPRLVSREKSLSRQMSRALSHEKTADQETDKKATERLIEEEKTETGTVKASVFLKYIKSIKVVNVVTMLIFMVCYQVASVLANLWLTEWTSDPVLTNTTINTSSPEYLHNRDKYLGVYGGLGAVQAFFMALFSFLHAISMVTASRLLHNGMLVNIMRAPMMFFDTTPIGRILNRFSRDVDTVDTLLPPLIFEFLAPLMLVLSTIFVISYSSPIFLVMVVPMGFIYSFVQRYFVAVSRQLKRFESTTRSPIYAHFSESINGATTIRAFRQQQRFLDKSERLIDRNQTFYIPLKVSQRWLNLRMDVLGGVIILATALFAVIQGGSISSGLVGLSLSYSLSFTQEFNWLVRQISEIETNIVAVERIDEYSHTEQEAEWYLEDSKPGPDWPEKGNVEFARYETRYRPGLDLVLKGISLEIQGGEKIGIVGRTGAGKSSLTLSLFRLIESAGGYIRVDGLRIDHMGLHQLRSRLTILPQDPVLFSGSLRMNIDPVNKYEDSELWVALERSHLKSFVQDLPDGLMHECGEGGQNLSVGQRQLVCLARTLLRKTRILVLDEATAAVDLETDDLIQKTIRTEFSHCTVLTIAHRINTIMDNDRVLVLDNGKIAEFDTPSNLLKNKDSVFYSLAKEAGLAL